MFVRNASGRSISLLNEPEHQSPPSSRSSSAEAPYTPPELQHTDSYDSSPRSAPLSPSTPVTQYESYSQARHLYHSHYVCAGPATQPGYEEYLTHHENRQQGLFPGSARSDSYDGELVPPREPPAKPSSGKRYPCRYRDSHGCDKTFTTSGHASRHSKIHTAEKSVECLYEGCTKKFTRSDNMKQHLETHKKDKPRRHSSSTSNRRSTNHSSRSTHRARAPARLDAGTGYSPVNPVAAPLVSPAGTVFNMGVLNTPLMAATPVPPQASENAALDTLALAAAHQKATQAL